MDHSPWNDVLPKRPLKIAASAVRCGVAFTQVHHESAETATLGLPAKWVKTGTCGKVAVRVEPWCDGKGATQWMPVCTECLDPTLPNISVKQYIEKQGQAQ